MDRRRPPGAVGRRPVPDSPPSGGVHVGIWGARPPGAPTPEPFPASLFS